MSSISLSLLLTLSLLLSMKLASESYTISNTSLSVRTCLAIAKLQVISPEPKGEYTALTENMQSKYQQLQNIHWKIVKWKAGLFSAYLQK